MPRDGSPTLVDFNGTSYWLRQSGALAPLEQCEETGELTFAGASLGDSYAHLCEDGTIRRFGVIIGTHHDLKPVTTIDVEAQNA